MSYGEKEGREEREKQPWMQIAGDAPAITSVDAVALYDPRDGRVVHMHHVVMFEGAEAQDRERQERNAMEAARALVKNVDELKVLHVPNFQLMGKAFRVDVKALRLVEISPPNRDRRDAKTSDAV